MLTKDVLVIYLWPVYGQVKAMSCQSKYLITNKRLFIMCEIGEAIGENKNFVTCAVNRHG